MPFSKKEWPLLATHLICLFVGVAVANISYEPCLAKTLSPYKILIPLTKGQFFDLKSNRVYDTQRVMLLRLGSKKEGLKCLVTEEMGRLRVQGSSLFVELGKSASSHFIKLVTEKKGLYRLVPSSRTLLYPLCQDKPEVSYGAR